MALVGGRRVELTRTDSSPCTVPDNPIARLMYYLEQVDSLLNIGFKNRIKDYSSYYLLDEEEKTAVVVASLLFSLDELMKHNVIIIAPELCREYSNEFYRLSDSRVNVIVDSDFMIGEKRVQVHKFMAIKEMWAMKNYINPIKTILNEQNKPKQSRPPQPRPTQSRPVTYTNHNSNDDYEADTDCCLLI